MFGDFHLNGLIHSSQADANVAQTTQYILNLCFSDACPVLTNTKFPGTQVVALDRANLPRLHGSKPIHMPYKASEIYSWLQGQPIAIPPLKLQTRWIATPLSAYALESIDFGSDESAEWFIPTTVSPSILLNLDFSFCVERK
jgi:hypothetical protein